MNNSCDSAQLRHIPQSRCPVRRVSNVPYMLLA